MFFQRRNSKKVKDSEGSKKKGKDGRGKNDLPAKNDAETANENLQGDVKSGIETILHKGSGLLEKVKELGSHSDASRSKELESKDKEPEPEEKAEEGEAVQNIDEGASADKTDEEPNVLEQAVEEIQAVAVALQQQTAPAAETETEIPVEAAAAAETSAQGDKSEETNREVEKDDPKKRLDFAGFFAMLFERCCSPGNKKKD